MISKYVMVKKIILFSLLMFIWVGCSIHPSVPGEFPDEEEMALVLADVYMVESVLGQVRQSYYSAKEDDVTGYYRYVLEKHSLSKQEFDSAMVWYSANPAVLSDVYEDVVVILSQRHAELKNAINQEKLEKESAIKLMDTLKLTEKQELWVDTTSFKLTADVTDSLDRRIPFSIVVDSLSDGNITLSAVYAFKESSFLDSAQMRMFTCYADSTIDTISCQIYKSFKEVDGNLSFTIGPDNQLVNIDGFLFDHDTTEMSSVVVDEIKLTFIPTMKGVENVK